MPKTKGTKKVGFAAMNPADVKRIASMGGKASKGGGRPKGSKDQH